MTGRSDIPGAAGPFHESGGEPGAPDRRGADARRQEAGRRLIAAAPAIATGFTQERTAWRSRSSWRSPLLEQLVQPLIVAIGRELQAPLPDVAAPWTRCPGTLRLSPTRGTLALVLDVSVLRRHILAAIAPAGSALARALVQDCLDVVLEGALGELAVLLGRTTSRPTLPFGGVIVELFEHEAAVEPLPTRRLAPRPML